MEKQKLENIIYVGNKKTVVSQLYSDPNRVQIVYIDKGKATAEDILFIDGKWSFEFTGPSGHDVSHMPAYSKYILILKRQ